MRDESLLATIHRVLIEDESKTLIDKRVLQHMSEIKSNHPDLVKYGGLGYCAFGSKLLSEVLTESKIDHKLIVTKYISDNDEGQKAKDAVISHIKDIDEDPDEILMMIKQQFIKKGDKIFKEFGHAVVLIGKTVYDITSKQFNLKEHYPVSLLNLIWDELYVGKITINSSSDFGVSSVKYLKKINT